MIEDSGCCGFHIGKAKVTFLGLLTFSFPTLLLSLGLNPVLYAAGRIWPGAEKAREGVLAIRDANLNLANKADLNSKFRCGLTGKVFPYSPRLAGIIYRYFNISLLALSWLLIISFLYLTVIIAG